MPKMDLMYPVDVSNCSYQIYYNPIFDENALLMVVTVKFHMIFLVLTVVENQSGVCWVLMLVEKAQLLALMFQLESLLEMKELVYIHAYALHITIRTLEFPRHNIVLIRQDGPHYLAS